MRVLVVKTSSLGDIIHALPAINLLVRKIPDVEIDWLIKPEFKNLLKYCPNLRKIIFFDGKKFEFTPKGFAYSNRLIQKIPTVKYDMVIDFQGLLRSALFAGFADSSLKVGFKKPRERLASFFYNKRIDVASKHAVERNIELVCGAIGAEFNAEIDEELLKLRHCEEFAQAADAILQQNRKDHEAKLVAVVPGARWESKKFPAEFFADIMKKVHASCNVEFMLLGGKDELPDGEKIENIGALSDMKILNLIGKSSIGESSELLRRADMILCNDSGPMHIGAAMGTPLCSFFGPTRPERTGPYGSQCKVFRNEECTCIGCLRRKCSHYPDVICQNIDTGKVAEYIIEKLT